MRKYFAALDERQLHEIAIPADEQVKNEIADTRSLTTRVLEKVEIRPTRIVKRNYLAIYYRVQGQLAQERIFFWYPQLLTETNG